MATQQKLSIEEVAERGTQLYESTIRSLVESGNIGRFLAIDVETGEFAVADQRHEAAMMVRNKNSNAQIWFIKIGHIAAAKFGGVSSLKKN